MYYCHRLLTCIVVRVQESGQLHTPTAPLPKKQPSAPLQFLFPGVGMDAVRREKIVVLCWESNHDLFRSQSRRALKLVFSLTALPRLSTCPFCHTSSKLIPHLQTETCCRLFQTVCRWLRWGTSFGCITLKDNYLVLFCGLLMMVFDIWTHFALWAFSIVCIKI
jgi:hypothetical protein